MGVHKQFIHVNGCIEANFVAVPFLDPETPTIETIKHPKFGKPNRIWPYMDKNGDLLGFICRFEVSDNDGVSNKEIRPYFHLSENAKPAKWQWKAMSGLRPLYNLHLMANDLTKPIIVCEGEKSADAASELFPNYVATTSLFGARSPQNADWSMITGRKVLIAGDVDEAGKAFVDRAIKILQENKASSIKILNVSMIGRCEFNNVGEVIADSRMECPAKFDLADALELGWTSEVMACYLDKHADEVLRLCLPKNWPFVIGKDHVFENVAKENEKENLVPVFSRMEVLGRLSDQNSTDWSALLSITDPKGRKHHELVRMSDLNGKGATDVISRLTAKGLSLVELENSRSKIWRFITHAPVKDDILLLSKTGWQNEKLFTTPTWQASTEECGTLFVDCSEEEEKCFSQKNSLKEWQEKIAIYGEENPLIAFALAAAFAAPLLKPLSMNGFGFHFFGASSTGKTTLLRIAASAWGPPGKSIKNWNATSTALEGTAVLHNDTILCLDEISQADPATVFEAAYQLANGQGKGRGTVTGGTQNRQTWLLLVLSNGEIGFDTLAKSKGGSEAMAGQRARMINIPADAGHEMGIFTKLPEAFSDPAQVSMMLNQNVEKAFGFPAEKFVMAFCEMDQPVEHFRTKMNQFIQSLDLDSHDGQVKRVAQNFALVAVAGEFAAEMGILPWKKNVATEAARFAYVLWLKERGGTQSDEAIQGMRSVSSFIQIHGDDRFTTMRKENQKWQATDEFDLIDAGKTKNRAGFKYLDSDGQWVYLIFPSIFRTEICKNRDVKNITQELLSRGHLVADSQGKSTVAKNLPGHNRARMYVVRASIVDLVDNETKETSNDT